MSVVAIVGAGELGGTLAHLLARKGIAQRIRLIDEAASVAAGKALDIMQAGPIEAFSARVSGTGDLSEGAGSDVFVLADPARGSWNLDAGLTWLTRLTRLSGSAPILCAGAGHREIVERGVREHGFARERLIGSAPAALAAALRAMMALEINGSPRDVSLTVLGVPPSQIVVPWEDATIGGVPAVRAVAEPVRRRLQSRISLLWPPGPIALAAAASEAVAALLGASRRQVIAFVAPDDSLGRKHRAAAVPVRLGPTGVIAVESLSLNAHDRTALENAILL